MLKPSSIQELQDMVVSHDRVLAVGGRTKTRLSAVDDCQIISTQGLSGITEYEPSEYTFTALAGTPVKDIHEAVQAKGQFLPCSALLRDSGATLGGAIASGLSGPGRFRFGGLRDFLLGIRYVAGDGKLISSGGKVVKNAAGFDLPKFMVGSLGRYGILTEVTFKVFPMPSTLVTLQVQCLGHRQAVERMARSAASRWELYAIDYDASVKRLYLRVGGPVDAVNAIIKEIHHEWLGQVETLTASDSDYYWDSVRELRWLSKGGCIAKVPISPKRITDLQLKLDQVPRVKAHYSVAGNVAGISTDDAVGLFDLSKILRDHGLIGMTIIGDKDTPLWLGERPSTAIETSLKQALDPLKKFPSLTPDI